VGILSRVFQRSTTLQNPDRWLLRAFGAGPTSSGVQVDESATLSSSAFWAGVRLIAESLSTVPLHVYRMTPSGERRVERDHPVDDLIYSSPNPEMTAQEWRSQMMAALILAGNSYNEIVRDRGGRIRQLWPLSWYRVEIKRAQDDSLYYQISTTGLDDVTDRQTVAILPSEQVLHLRGFNVRGLLGESMVNKLRETIGITIATEAFGASFYGSGTTLSGVLEHPGELSEAAQKRLKASWDARHSGLSRAHRIAILEEGMKFTPISVPPEAAQFLETRQFQVQEAARALRLPPHMIGDLSRATFSNIEHQAIEFVTHSLRPWASILEQRMQLSLLTPQERAQGYYIRHNLEGLLRGDIKARYDAYAVGRQWGWLSVDDIRALEDLNPIENGDIYLQPMNMVPAGMAGEVEPQEAEESDLIRAVKPEVRALDRREHTQRSAEQRRKMRDVYRPLLRDATQTIVKGELRAIRRAVEENLRGASSLGAWVEQYYGPGFRNTVERVLGPVIRAYQRQIALMAGSEVGGDAGDLDGFIQSYIEMLARRYAGYSKTQLLDRIASLSGEELDASVEALLAKWEEGRADDVASEESVRAGSAILRAAYGALGVTALRWVADADPCPFCREVAGTVVTVIEPFVSAGTSLSAESGEQMQMTQTIMNPPLHRGCECELVPEF
jgi:HK97 family phage portal protein